MAIAWVIITGLVAKSRLDAVRGELHQLRSAVSSGDIAQAQTLSARIAQQTASAHALTSGPAWWVGSNIPLLGTPLRTGRIVAYQADLIGHDALPGVLHLANAIVTAPKSKSSIDLAPLAQANTVLGTAATTVDHASSAIDASDPSWLPLVSNARGSAVTELQQLDTQVHTANRALATVLPMLGAKTPQRYFLGFMNEAESRGLGGIPGAFAIVTADRGKLQFSDFHSDDYLRHVRAKVSLGAQFNALYKQDDPTGFFQNSNISPNFPDAARIWAGMWQAKTGQHIDGALAIDPSAIAYLLKVTGPAQFGKTQVTAQNVVTLTQATEYQHFPGTSANDTLERKNYLTNIAKAVALQVQGASSIRALGSAAQRAIHERRLVVWSDVPAQEATITHFGLGGVLAAGDHPFAGFATTNGAGSKLDFYLQTAMTYKRSACTTGATTTSTLKLTSGTPSYALPPYVTTYLAKPRPKDYKVGDNLLIVSYYATPGATLKSVQLDGKTPSNFTMIPENGLFTIRLNVELPAGSTRTLTVTTSEPAATGPVQIFRQAAVRPITVRVDAPSC